MPKKMKTLNRNTFLEQIMLVVAVIEPFSSVPQLILLYNKQNAESLSLLSSILYLSTSCLWLAYALKIRSKPLIASSGLWAISETLLVTGILLYK